jgi:hypothetical protein
MASMKIHRQATVQDLLQMPKDGRTYELVDGAILVSPAGMTHSKSRERVENVRKTVE